MNEIPLTTAQSDNRTKVVSEALRHTEMRLQDLEAFASNADRRATAFAATSAAVAAILIANASRATWPIAFYAVASALIFSGILATWSQMPRKFEVRGHFWRDWAGHVETDDSLVDVLISQAKENDVRIDLNEKALVKSARIIKWAFYLFVSSLCSAIVLEIWPILKGYLCR